MQAILYADLVKKTVSDTLGGSAFNWPKFQAGEDIVLGFRFTSWLNGTAYEVSRTVLDWSASIGRPDVRPTDGSFTLRIDDAVNTGVLAWNATEAQVQAAMILLGAGYECSVKLRDGSYWILFNDGLQHSIECETNKLFPISFVRVHASEVDGKWMHEVRLVQAPVAKTDVQERILPPGPVVERVREGGEADGTKWTEVQSIKWPPAFRGTYQIKIGNKRTVILDRQSDGPVQVQAALNAIADEEGSFSVTNPAVGLVHVEYLGIYAGEEQDLLEVVVFSAPEGDVTCTLSLNRHALFPLLNAQPAGQDLVLPLEIIATFEDPNDDTKVIEAPLVRADVTILKPVSWAGLTVMPDIDWTRPPFPRRYVPQGAGQIITAPLFKSFPFGDGVNLVHVIDHDMDAEVMKVAIRENTAPGASLIEGEDYTIRFINNNSLEVTLLGDVPGNEALLIGILAMGPRPAYQEHTHSIAEVDLLADILAQMSADIALLMSLVPTGALSGETSTSETLVIAEWIFPKLMEVYPKGDAVEADTVMAINAKELPRPGGLLAAVHDAAVEAITVPVPDAAAEYIGRVFQNQTINDVEITGGLGVRSGMLKPNEFAACDGRLWYRVAKYVAEETSYYPAAFERELFFFAVNDKQLRLRKRLTVDFTVELAVLNSNTKAQWEVVVEWGSIAEDAAPAGVNLSAINWNATPILKQRMILTPVSHVHSFGVRIARALVKNEEDELVDTITASRVLYGAEETSESKPATGNFVLRARLIRFDTENSQNDPKGFVALAGLAGSAGAGKATIQ